MKETDLILELEGQGSLIPPLSIRECHQTLSLLPWGSLRRTVNGELIPVGVKGVRKFLSTITCQDIVPPAFHDLKRGQLLKVGCLQGLTLPVTPGSSIINVDYPVVEAHLYTSKGHVFPMSEAKGKTISVPSDFPGGFLTYRPWLWMMVKSFEFLTNEWEQSVAWTLELEEQ